MGCLDIALKIFGVFVMSLAVIGGCSTACNAVMWDTGFRLMEIIVIGFFLAVGFGLIKLGDWLNYSSFGGGTRSSSQFEDTINRANDIVSNVAAGRNCTNCADQYDSNCPHRGRDYKGSSFWCKFYC